MEELAQRIQDARAAAGLTQFELGALANIHPSRISRIEKGKSVPRTDVLMRLAEAMGTTVAQLVGEDEAA